MQFMKKVMRRITILLGITSLVMCLKRNNTMNESTRKEKLLRFVIMRVLQALFGPLQPVLYRELP